MARVSVYCFYVFKQVQRNMPFPIDIMNTICYTIIVKRKGTKQTQSQKKIKKPIDKVNTMCYTIDKLRERDISTENPKAKEKKYLT